MEENTGTDAVKAAKPASKPKLASLMSRLAAKVAAIKPKKGDAGCVEVGVIGNQILSDVKYVLDLGLRPIDDLATSLPFGRTVEVFGLEACGKSALCIRAAVRAQEGHVYKIEKTAGGKDIKVKLDPASYNLNVLYIDNERSLEDDEKITVDGIKLSQEKVLVMYADTVDLVFKTVDKVMVEVLAEQERTKIPQFLVIIVDTIAGTASAEELSQEWGSQDYARQPKQLKAGFRNLNQQISRQNVLFLATNQVSDKMGYVDMSKNKNSNKINHAKYETSGGKALKYYSSLRIFMYQKEVAWKMAKGARFQAGILIGFKVVKNRIKKPYREGLLLLLLDDKQGGLRDDFSILETMLDLKFAETDPADYNVIIFKFKRNGIPLTTFGAEAVAKSLEEQDEEESAAAMPVTVGSAAKKERHKDPRISSKGEWPSFYLAHKADFDALWAKAVDFAFATEGLGTEVDDEEIEDNDDEPVTAVNTSRNGRIAQLTED